MKKKFVTLMLAAMASISCLTGCSVSTGTNIGKIDVYDTLRDADVTNYRDVLNDLEMDQAEASNETHSMKNGDGSFSFKIDGERYEFSIDDYAIVSVANSDGDLIWTDESDMVDMIESLPTDIVTEDVAPEPTGAATGASIGATAADEGVSDDNTDINANESVYDKIHNIDTETGKELFVVCDYDGNTIYKFIEPDGYHVNKEYVENKYGKNAENLFFLKSDTNSSQVDIRNSVPMGIIGAIDDAASESYKKEAAKYTIHGVTDPTKYNPWGYVIAEDEYSYYAVLYGDEYQSLVLTTNKMDHEFKDNLDKFVTFVCDNF